MLPSRKRALIIWITALAAVFLFSRLSNLVQGLGLRAEPLEVLQFLSWTFLIATTLYLFGVSIRFVLRSLFWRVGRRLALSYFLIGLLPFIFFAVMLVVVGYLMAGVLSQAEFRDERQATINRLDQWNLEYALTGVKPPTALPTLEIYDTREASAAKLPKWLRKTSFLGLARRGDQPLFVSSRFYKIDGANRTVVFVQPFDDVWAKSLEDRNGMMVRASIQQAAGSEGRDGVKIRTRSESPSIVEISGASVGDEDDPDIEIDDAVLQPFIQRAWRRNGVIWGDPTPPLVSWEDGEPGERAFILISNPWSNLLSFYFGSSRYVQAILGVILGIASLLAVVYFLAVILAGGLIYSITRAVNRIEKGTKAVERGDFSYRIGLKPRNQLGEVASSFDRMTASVASLLTKVGEQERLQSEIDIAASIQRNLLPKEGPQIRGISFSAHFEPTASIGGDYYDVFNLDERRLAVAIGDVSGHGLSTGLVMAMVKAGITTLVEEGVDETSLFLRLNELVHRSTEKRAFMTLAFTIFDLDRKTIRHTNAGHLYPYLLRAGSLPRAIEAPSLPLGVKGEFEPKTIELGLQESDTLVYLSDGIIEAQNATGDPFGFDRLEKILGRLQGTTPAAVQSAILTELALHTGERPSDDDRTVMVLRFDQIHAKARPYVEEELAPAATRP
jgi:serine phosphatase RsbU (regulator of sigma subunit)